MWILIRNTAGFKMKFKRKTGISSLNVVPEIVFVSPESRSWLPYLILKKLHGAMHDCGSGSALFWKLDADPHYSDADPQPCFNGSYYVTWSVSRGRTLGRNPDKSLKSFPTCYSQSPLPTALL
jgi:hypothetical protein